MTVRKFWPLACWLCCSACRKEEPPPAPRESASRTLPAPAGHGAAVPSERLDLVSALPSCEIEHEGRLFDFGAEQSASRGFVAPRAEPPVNIDRNGETFERISSREVTLDVWLDEPLERAAVSLRAFPFAAKVVYVSIDDKRLGAQKLVSNETRSYGFTPLAQPLGRGRHRVTLSFAGARGSKEPAVDLDWVRFGAPPEDLASYAAPTLKDVVSDVVLSGLPRRSIVLRPASVVRCLLRPSADARLRVDLGLWGNGRGNAEIALLSDDKPRRVLATHKLFGGDGASFTPVTLDLSSAAGELVGLELRAREGSAGARVAFGDPFLIRGTPNVPRVPPARTVVLVVLSSVDRARLPPWGPTGALSALADLGKHGVAFSAHRAPSTVAAASLASLLSGAPPEVTGVQAPGDRLRARLVTVAETVKEAGGRTAFFTGVPTSFAPFGLQAGFDVFESLSPVADLPASEPLARATRFLDQEVQQGSASPTFVVVQLRGAHPPWDLSHEETTPLKPLEYSGILDPRRGGIVLGGLRSKRKRVARRMGDDDWVRLRALHDAALAKQDEGLAKLVALLKQKNAWADTLLVVTSDVGLGAGPDLPFEPGGPLLEERLSLPLIVRFPGDARGGSETSQPTSAEDVAATLLRALGLENDTARGGDLFTRASGTASLAGSLDRASVADTYSARLGGWLLRGTTGKEPRLCAAEVDPACTGDVLDQKPLAARTAWQLFYDARKDAVRRAARLGEKRRAELDPETIAALTVWGDLQ